MAQSEEVIKSGVSFLKEQTPTVIIAIVGVGAMFAMGWFGKVTGELATGGITLVSSVALVMNFKIQQLNATKKEGGS